jgi:hypothetical protein
VRLPCSLIDADPYIFPEASSPAAPPGVPGKNPRRPHTAWASPCVASRMMASTDSCSGVVPRLAAGDIPSVWAMSGMSAPPSADTLAMAHRESSRPDTICSSRIETCSCRESRSMVVKQGADRFLVTLQRLREPVARDQQGTGDVPLLIGLRWT